MHFYLCTKYLLSCINKNSQKFFKVAKYACNAHFISSPKGMQVLTDRESNKNWNDFLWLYFVVSKNAQIFSIFVQIQLLKSLIREPFNNNLSSMRICLCIFFLLLFFLFWQMLRFSIVWWPFKLKCKWSLSRLIEMLSKDLDCVHDIILCNTPHTYDQESV